MFEPQSGDPFGNSSISGNLVLACIIREKAIPR
jgi:hypothetical protein